ncbi:MAG TPA: hypothetical protein V6C91_19100 [Coleofasciculaceae cyanobacterium]
MSQPEGNDGQERKAEASQDDNQRNTEHEARGLGASNAQGKSAGDVQNTTGNSTGKRRDSDRHIETERGKIFGGILRQLIADNDDQLADYRSKIEKLEHRRLQLLALYEQLQLDIGEGEDEEPPEEELSEDEAQVRSEEE